MTGSNGIWSEIFCSIIGKPSQEELEIYQCYYNNTKRKRDLFCHAINYDNGKLEEDASNFLFHLNLFYINVPRRIRKKKFEDFKETEGLAKDILTTHLFRLKKQRV